MRQKGTDLPTKLEDSWAATKTWPPQHHSHCQRCGSVKRLSEEKGSLFNSSPLTPCHCRAGTGPGAGRVVRAALHLVSYTPALKIRRLCSPVSPLHGLIIAKTRTIHFCTGLTVNLALSGCSSFVSAMTGVGGDVTAIFRNEGRGVGGLLGWLGGEEPACQCRRHGVRCLGREDPTCREIAKAGVPWLRSLCFRGWEPWPLKPARPGAHALQGEKLSQWATGLPQLEGDPCSPGLEKACDATRPSTAK